MSDGLDVVFLDCPRGVDGACSRARGHVGCVVDLSASTVQGRRAVPAYYGFEHDQPEFLEEAVYGLPSSIATSSKGAR